MNTGEHNVMKQQLRWLFSISALRLQGESDESQGDGKLVYGNAIKKNADNNTKGWVIGRKFTLQWMSSDMITAIPFDVFFCVFIFGVV